uniref:Uncharacterized protein n=1 Tax=Leersia perrieri TaxID=77586 RepID=A0A0D9WGV9_9ORYZ
MARRSLFVEAVRAVHLCRAMPRGGVGRGETGRGLRGFIRIGPIRHTVPERTLTTGVRDKRPKPSLHLCKRGRETRGERRRQPDRSFDRSSDPYNRVLCLQCGLALLARSAVEQIDLKAAARRGRSPPGARNKIVEHPG